MRLPNSASSKHATTAPGNRRSLYSALEGLTDTLFFPAKYFSRAPLLFTKHHVSSYSHLHKLRFIDDTLESDEQVETIRKCDATVVAFVDGSVVNIDGYCVTQNHSGAAYAFRDEITSEEFTRLMSTGRAQSSYGAETKGLAELCHDLHQYLEGANRTDENICIFTDPLSRIGSLKSIKIEDHEDLEVVEAADRLCVDHNVTLGHVRGHAQITGNEYAKAATELSKGEDIYDTFAAAKSRIEYVLGALGAGELKTYITELPESRVAQAAAFNQDFQFNCPMKGDVPRSAAVLVNNIELGLRPRVFSEDSWCPGHLRRCQFCGGSGTAMHFLYVCPQLSDVRESVLGIGYHENARGCSKDINKIAAYILEIASRVMDPDPSDVRSEPPC